MALTNDQITAQNFKDFYQQILPYLGKSGGGGSMNYSTDEQVVGTWIDGKPLYQKTFVFTAADCEVISGKLIETPAFNITNGTIIDVDALATLNGRGNCCLGTKAYTTRNSNYWEIQYLYYNRIGLFTNLTYSWDEMGLKVFVTVRYTKTTD